MILLRLSKGLKRLRKPLLYPSELQALIFHSVRSSINRIYYAPKDRCSTSPSLKINSLLSLTYRDIDFSFLPISCPMPSQLPCHHGGFGGTDDDVIASNVDHRHAGGPS